MRKTKMHSHQPSRCTIFRTTPAAHALSGNSSTKQSIRRPLIRNIIGIAFFLLPLFVGAQTKERQHAEQTWVGYNNQTRISNKWGVWIDGHLRTRKDFIYDLSQSIARAGLTYYVNEATWLTAGYGYVTDYPTEGHNYVSRPEHRPWQQVQWQTKWGRTSSTQRFRLEERWRHKMLNDSTRADGWNFNYRARYSLSFQVPLTGPATRSLPVALVLQDEVLINFGRQVVYNYFDHNRLFCGLNFTVVRNNTLQVGYMNHFRQLASGNKFRTTHIARIYYYHNIDLRKKDNR